LNLELGSKTDWGQNDPNQALTSYKIFRRFSV